MLITKEEKKEITKHISKIGGFNEKTKGYHAVENLLILGEWSFHWYEKSFCIQNASWLQHIGLEVEVLSDAVKVSDEGIEKYYINVMGLVPEFQPVGNNLSGGDRGLRVGKEESSGTQTAHYE
ncbi:MULTISPECIES: hypothetical protein [unclassified Flavobacterium]|uniref:hypothetical protein n=1 Tax=unclassified Flavobacterium TaxID=196869 RepID=UPI00105EABB2|nr:MULTISPECIES: hypothetical protein [unclassified Flavobacterium]TDP00276.1 hypothetical protein EV145_106167 [Flavobacterium sp. 245]TDW52116.1 hypothetical protein EV144_101798 [Flavobacterium sp. 270]